MTLKKYATTF